MFGRSPTPLTADLLGLLDDCVGLVKREAGLNKELEGLALATDPCRRWMDIPGVGPICALTFYAAVAEPTRFRKSASVGSYLGLTPRIRQSGLSQRTGRISRMGNREARSLLIQASIRFMQCTGPDDLLHQWACRIEQRRGKGKSRVALARKLATVMVAMWKNSDVYRPQLAQMPV